MSDFRVKVYSLKNFKDLIAQVKKISKEHESLQMKTNSNHNRMGENIKLYFILITKVIWFSWCNKNTEKTKQILTEILSAHLVLRVGYTSGPQRNPGCSGSKSPEGMDKGLDRWINIHDWVSLYLNYFAKVKKELRSVKSSSCALCGRISTTKSKQESRKSNKT